ncbi:hypothetical protein KFE25_009920 [Diacronema lutheri]|uniref:EF-hand domain-containing protein n=1 Tax=Diacronema lutheri TaxID=2081491 RepID=A0A8J5XML7_DIALT|nr:hypothetical protein KFE25_009920 [Diacronema lutheri]|mmetsp:Transcript_19400/g.60417  ORF Transcript_19400/g.60417 Transcript_19400/m.60417 type:complete len:231 (-) Transcript_19400:191-883(-)
MLSALVSSSAPQVDDELLEELSVTTYFTRDEIRRLHRRFVALDAANRGSLSAAQLFQLPELEHNQMRARLEAVWATELEADVDLRAFVRLLSPFAPSCPREQKFRFAFRVHDADGDGKIGESDVRGLISALLGDYASGTDVEAAAAGGTAARAARTATATVVPAGRANIQRRFASRALADAAELDGGLIDKIVDYVFHEVDSDDSRTISFEEWVRLVANTDIVSKLTLHP